MKYKHYAPCAEMILFDGEIGSVRKAMDAEAKELEKQGKSVFKLSFTDEKLAAHELFAKLREADELGVDVIWQRLFPNRGLAFQL